MNKKILLLFFTILIDVISAQTLSFKDSVKVIKSSGKYYWGIASSKNVTEAEQNALSDLISQIAVNVTSSFEQNISGKNEDFNESVNKVLKTYSTASLRDPYIVRDFYNGKIYVLSYIEKTKIKESFEKRKKLCYDLYQNAIGFEGDDNFSDALKNYYYSIILMNSLPDQNIEISGTNLKTEVPKRINNILKGVKFKLISSREKSPKEKILNFAVSVNGKPANNLQFSFWAGNNSIDACAKDGTAEFSLLGASVTFPALTISIKYEYYNTRNQVKDVAELWNLVKKPEFENSFKVNLNNEETPQIYSNKTGREGKIFNTKDTVKPPTYVKQNNGSLISKIKSGKIKLSLNYKYKCNVKREINKNALLFLELLNKNDISGLNSLLGNDTFLKNKVMNIIKYNKIQLLNDSIHADLNTTVNGYEIRKINVLNKYKSLRKQSKEYLVIDFDKKGNLYDVNFGIMDHLYKEFVEEAKYGNDWGNRQIIIKFMEKYRTAYLSRDLNVLGKIFADNALIIVGRVLKELNIKDFVKYKYEPSESQPTFEQIRYSKKEYLKRQKRIFQTRKEIFLDFSKFNILRKNNTKGVYGISLRQNYESTGYSDEGYLFLLIDFNKVNPQIYVRSWQPQEWDSTSLIGLSNFKINN